jgi:hypothetical protein
VGLNRRTTLAIALAILAAAVWILVFVHMPPNGWLGDPISP